MGGSDFRPGFDERREVWRLLCHLHPQERIKFLQECCNSVSRDGAVTKVLECDGTVEAVLWDLFILCYSHNLSLNTIGERLVEWVRRFGR